MPRYPYVTLGCSLCGICMLFHAFVGDPNAVLADLLGGFLGSLFRGFFGDFLGGPFRSLFGPSFCNFLGDSLVALSITSPATCLPALAAMAPALMPSPMPVAAATAERAAIPRLPSTA